MSVLRASGIDQPLLEPNSERIRRISTLGMSLLHAALHQAELDNSAWTLPEARGLLARCYNDAELVVRTEEALDGFPLYRHQSY